MKNQLIKDDEPIGKPVLLLSEECQQWLKYMRIVEEQLKQSHGIPNRYFVPVAYENVLSADATLFRKIKNLKDEAEGNL